MSASQNRRKRNQASKYRDTRTASEQKAQRTFRRRVIVVICVVVVVFGAALIINSGFMRREATAMTVGDVKVAPADFNYYYYSAFYDYEMYVYQNASQYASSLLPNTQQSLKSQVFDQSTGQTWDDYIRQTAQQNMQTLFTTYQEALKENFTMSDDDRQQMESDIASAKTAAEQSGYNTFKKYLAARYGPGVNEAVYDKAMEISYTNAAFIKSIQNSYTYTPDDLASYYEANKDSLDMFTFRYFLVQPESIDTSTMTDDQATDATNAAIETAYTQAQQLTSQITDDASFISTARAYDPTTYADDSSTLHSVQGSTLGSAYASWLQDSSRKDGDVTAVQATSSGSYVVMFISRDENEYNMVSMRQLLVAPETVDADDYITDQYTDGSQNPDYQTAVTQADSDAEQKANLLYQQWQSEGGTEDQLVALMSGNSADTTTGGLYEDIYKGEMVSAVNDWLFDPSRKAGDSGIVKSDDGYHILYFVSTEDQTYHDYLAQQGKSNADYNDWESALSVPTIQTHWAYRFAV